MKVSYLFVFISILMSSGLWGAAINSASDDYAWSEGDSYPISGNDTLIITANNIIKSYGDLYVFNNEEFTVTGLSQDHSLTLLLSSDGAPAPALAGFYDIEIGSVVIKDADNEDVTSNYHIITVKGVLGVEGPVIVYNQDPNLPGTVIVTYHMTIQQAIDAATTLPGHFVSVSSGVYDELVNFTKSVTLSGFGSDNTQIEKNSPAADANFITISASDVIVKDIAIVGPVGGSTSRGIHINGTLSNISFVNVISNQHNYGMHVNGSSSVTNLSLNNVQLNVNGNGLQIDENASVDGLSITASEMNGNSFGLAVAANTSVDNSNGLLNVSITNSTFNGNTFFGMLFNKGQNMTLTGLTVNQNTQAGIYFTWRNGTYGNITVQNSTINGNGTNGIWVRPRASASATGVNITGCAIISNATGVRVEKNDDNTGSDPGVVINGNSIITNTNFGIASTTIANINATCNWWDSNDWNIIGNAISGNIVVAPFLVPNPDGNTFSWSGSDTYSCTGETPISFVDSDGNTFYFTDLQDAINALPVPVVGTPGSGGLLKATDEDTGEVSYYIKDEEGNVFVLTLSKDVEGNSGQSGLWISAPHDIGAMAPYIGN